MDANQTIELPPGLTREGRDMIESAIVAAKAVSPAPPEPLPTTLKDVRKETAFIVAHCPQDTLGLDELLGAPGFAEDSEDYFLFADELRGPPRTAIPLSLLRDPRDVAFARARAALTGNLPQLLHLLTARQRGLLMAHLREVTADRLRWARPSIHG
jgi:hypothetical protein